MKNNPFKTLGLEPSLLRAMSDREIRKLLKEQRNNLQRIWHPDCATNTEEQQVYMQRSMQINEAYECLQDQANFTYYKKRFIHREKAEEEQLELLEKFITKHQQHLIIVALKILELIQAYKDRERERNVFHLHKKGLTVSAADKKDMLPHILERGLATAPDSNGILIGGITEAFKASPLFMVPEEKKSKGVIVPMSNATIEGAVGSMSELLHILRSIHVNPQRTYIATHASRRKFRRPLCKDNNEHILSIKEFAWTLQRLQLTFYDDSYNLFFWNPGVGITYGGLLYKP